MNGAAIDAAETVHPRMPPPPPRTRHWDHFLRHVDRDQKKIAEASGLSVQQSLYGGAMDVDRPVDPLAGFQKLVQEGSSTPTPTTNPWSGLSIGSTNSASGIAKQADAQQIVVAGQASTFPVPPTAVPATTTLRDQFKSIGLPFSEENCKAVKLLLVKDVAGRLAAAISKLGSTPLDDFTEARKTLRLSQPLHSGAQDLWKGLFQLTIRVQEMDRRYGGVSKEMMPQPFDQLSVLTQRCEEIEQQALHGCSASWTAQLPQPTLEEISEDSALKFMSLTSSMNASFPNLIDAVRKVLSHPLMADAGTSQSNEMQKSTTIPEWLEKVNKSMHSTLTTCKNIISRQVDEIREDKKSGKTVMLAGPELAYQTRALSVALWNFALREEFTRHIKALKSRYLPTFALFQEQEDAWKALWELVHAGLLNAFQIDPEDKGRSLVPDAEKLNQHKKRQVPTKNELPVPWI